MLMPAGAKFCSAFMTIRLYEPLRRLPQMLMTLSVSSAMSFLLGVR
jgi:hypothetical protein